MITGQSSYAPEVFARATQLVWHYGMYSSVTNARFFELKSAWLDETNGGVETEGQASKTRILVLASRGLYCGNTHTCDDTCIGLPTSPFLVESKQGGYECQYCGRPFDPISTRYLCPYEDCKMKNTCCEG